VALAPSVTRAQAIAGQTGNESETDDGKDEEIATADAQKVEIDGRQQYFRLQDRWSESIIDWITGLLIFNCLLVLFVGFDLISYDKQPWLITAFVTEIFLQVIGLGYIAARFLFPGGGNKPPKRKAGGKPPSSAN
jgi:hypothetical protein